MPDALIWTVSGAVLSVILQTLFNYIGQMKSGTNLYGKWHSAWQPAVEDGWTWINEVVVIKKTLFGIGIESMDDNDIKWRWKGRAKLVDDTYLTGEWMAISPGSNVEGVFALTFSMNGKYLMGFFLSRDTNKPKIITSFILGRTLKDVKEAQDRMQKLRIKYPKTIEE